MAAVSLLKQILFVEAEADRLDIWAGLAESDDAEEMLRRRALIARETVRTLDAVMRHREQFAAIVRGKKP